MYDWQALKSLADGESDFSATLSPIERQLMLALLVSVSWREFEGVTDPAIRDEVQATISGAIGKLT